MAPKVFLLVFGLQTPEVFVQTRELQQLFVGSRRILINDYILLNGLANVGLENAAAWVVVGLELSDRRPEVDLREC